MPYLCYIHRASSEVPHLEVLPEITEGEAIDRVIRLMTQKADALRAEVWDGERLVFTVPRAIQTAESGAGRSFAS